MTREYQNFQFFDLLMLNKIFRANGKREENPKSGTSFDRDTSYSVQMPRRSRLDIAKWRCNSASIKFGPLRPKFCDYKFKGTAVIIKMKLAFKGTFPTIRST